MLRSFPIEKEYSRCITELNDAGILELLPSSKSKGVIGIDAEEYPVPSLEETEDLFVKNEELIARKAPQGFDRLELTPMAMSTSLLIEIMNAAILRHAEEDRIFQTRRSPSDPLIPVYVNNEKQVWIWDTLRQALDSDDLVYFPQKYSIDHLGQTKMEAVNNGRICGIPGWSVGLVEDIPILPRQGQGIRIGGREQLEIGSSPREYLDILHTEPYQGETGRTLEDIITRFLTHLVSADEVSNDVNDDNASWCLGQYLRVSYAELVPTGRWIRDVGRVRLDMHRTGNKQCTKSWGVSTVVRLPRPLI
jgi:hypothetical protein